MTVHVVVMAKAPVAGSAKTRLAPVLGAEGAAALAQRLLDHALAQALAAGIGPVTLCAAPDAHHAAFDAWRGLHGLELASQSEGDLGTRMHDVFQQHTGPVLLMGSDAPALDAALLRRAADALAQVDAVFVPAFDGGYALVGLHRPCAALFEHMVWSVPAVMAHTRERAREAGMRHLELDPVHDIDGPGDLAHLPETLSSTVATDPILHETRP
jgi:rSAM/selenodomain-associated transferase 1